MLLSSARARMWRVAAIAALWYVLGACSTLGKVEMVDAPPQQCQLLKELSFHRACDHEGKIVPEDLTIFRRLAVKSGADTVHCCRVAEDEEVLLGMNPRTGEMCVTARQRSATAYLCGKGKR
jgi:hypothetical protein